MSHTFSALEVSKVGLVEGVTGGKAHGLVTRTTNAKVRELDGTKIVDFAGRNVGDNAEARESQIQIIGYDTASGMGGPKIILAGKTTPGKREIIIDKVFARKNGLTLGDQIEAFGKIVTIVGLTEKNNMLIYSRGFMDQKELQDILKEKNQINFVLLNLADPAETESMVEKLNRDIDGITAYELTEFARMNGEEITNSFLPIIMVVTIIGFMTGVVVIGMTIYTSTIEKLREFGVLKAIGATDTMLFFIVFEQSLWYSILGFAGGVLLTAGITKLAMELVPVIIAEYTNKIYIFVFISTLVMSAVASFIPIRKISKIDPAMVFKA